MHSKIINYLLIFLYYASLYAICANTKTFYQSNPPLLTFLIVLFIFIYRGILSELNLRKGDPGLPHSKFHTYFGSFIQKHYDFFARYVGAYQIVTKISKIELIGEGKIDFSEKDPIKRFLAITYHLIFIIFNFICYYWAIVYFFIAHPSVGFILNNLINSLIELTITNANALEKEAEATVETLTNKLNKNTVTHINPLILNAAMGIGISIALKKKAYSVIKNALLLKKTGYIEFTSTLVETMAIGSLASTFIAMGEYYSFIDPNVFNAVQYAKYQDVITPYNEYVIEQNVKKYKQIFINCIENARNEEELREISDFYTKLPEKSRMILKNDYEEGIYQAKKKWKE